MIIRIRRRLTPEIEGMLGSDTLAKDLSIIDETAMRVAKIVKGLHSFARSGENDRFQAIVLKDVIDHTLGLCLERLRAKGVTFVIDELPDLVFHCRETQIIQVLLNLLNNALYDAFPS